MAYRTCFAAAALLVAWSTGGALADGGRPLDVVNGTRTAIIGLQARPAGTEAWQTDELAKTRRTLGLQKMVTIFLPANGTCLYDFRLMFEDGHSSIKRGIETCKTRLVRLTEY